MDEQKLPKKNTGKFIDFILLILWPLLFNHSGS